jgi:hypothetical protein
MGFIKLISLSENIAIDPWELAVLNSLKFNPALENKILKSDLFCCYFEINSFIGFSIRNNKKTSLKKLKEFIQNEIGELSFDKITFLITFIGEGITINKSTDLVNLLIKLGSNIDNIRILYSTKEEFSDNPKTVSFWEFFIKIPVYQIETDKNSLETIPIKHALCLVRKIKKDRVLFFEELIKYDWWNDKTKLDLSFGVYGEDLNQFDFLGSETKLLLPIIFDDNNVTDEKQHKHLSNDLTNQLMNVVVETFIITNPKLEAEGFITEKSMKPFFYYQLPIWVAQKGIVKIIRDLGFDVFDDFFENHYYDDIEDGELRMKEVLELLDRKIKIPTKILPSIKKHYKERLIKNYEHLLYLDSINKKMFGDKLDKLLF